MNRRKFLKLSLSGVAAAGTVKETLFHAQTLLAATSAWENLSLAVITDQPELATSRFAKMLDEFNPDRELLTFEQSILPGVQIGDVVVIRDNVLVDFRRNLDEFSRQVLAISNELGMPRQLKNPVLLSFATETLGQKARTVNVYHRQTLVKQFDIKDQFSHETIQGTRGALVFSMQDRHLQVVSTSCKHKTCMGMGSIHKPGQNLVCVPNELRIAIAGQNEYGIDSVTF